MRELDEFIILPDAFILSASQHKTWAFDFVLELGDAELNWAAMEKWCSSLASVKRESYYVRGIASKW